MPYMPSSNAGLMCHQPNFLLHRNCWLFLIAALLYGALYGYADQIRRRRVRRAPRRRLEETPPATNALRALPHMLSEDCLNNFNTVRAFALACFFVAASAELRLDEQYQRARQPGSIEEAVSTGHGF